MEFNAYGMEAQMDDFDDNATVPANWQEDVGLDGPYQQGQDDKSARDGSGRKFACPYFKRDPGKYRNSRSCTGPGWASVRRTKEHLYRVHRAIFCPRCFAVFGDDKPLKGHLREGSCRALRGVAKRPEGLDDEQIKQLRRRKRGSDKSEPEKWVDMYRIVFPHDNPDMIPSPYYDYVPVETTLPGQLSHDLDPRKFADFHIPEFHTRIRCEIEQEIRPMLADSSKEVFEYAVTVVQRMVLEALVESQKRSPVPSVPAMDLQPHSLHGGYYAGTFGVTNLDYDISTADPLDGSDQTGDAYFSEYGDGMSFEHHMTGTTG